MKIGPREQALREMRERQLVAARKATPKKRRPDDLDPVGAEQPRGPKPKSGGAAARRR